MHPFLDVSKLTDEEIIGRLGRAYSYLNAQVSLGHGPTAASIEEVIHSLENERAARINHRSDAEFIKKYPRDNTIEIGKVDDLEGQL